MSLEERNEALRLDRFDLLTYAATRDFAYGSPSLLNAVLLPGFEKLWKLLFGIRTRSSHTKTAR